MQISLKFHVVRLAVCMTILLATFDHHKDMHCQYISPH